MVKKLILDSNLLLLFVVGLASPAYIGGNKNLNVYSSDDFALLVRLVGHHAGLVLTPNTVTETSNLVDREKHAGRRARVAESLRFVVARWGESYVPSTVAFARGEYVALGVTDAVMLSLCASLTVLLTADLDLFIHAIRNGYAAINFNHLRDDCRFS